MFIQQNAKKGWGGILSVALMGLAVSAAAASLDSPAEPTDPASAMYTLQDIFNRLDTGVAGAKRAGPFAEPAAESMANTQCTTDDIMGKAPTVNAGAAADTDVLSGKEYWSLKNGAWGKLSGAMAIRILSAANADVAVGYYAATNLVQVEPNLTSANIKGGAAIFGVAGKTVVMDTSAGTAVAGDILPGKTAYVAGTQVTGDITNRVLTSDNDALAAGTHGATNLAEVEVNLTAANVRYGVAIFGVAGNNTNLADTSSGTASAAEIRTNKVAWVNGATVTGTVAVQTLTSATRIVPAGIYGATNLAEVETNLTPDNIRTNVTIFGIPGAIDLDTHAAVGVWKTGQTLINAAGGDGHLRKGVAWPNPRFTKVAINGNTHVIDNLTGLTWTYLTKTEWSGYCSGGLWTNWSEAINVITNLAGPINGTNATSPGSPVGGFTDWRLPTITELQSLVYCGKIEPALANTVGTAGWTAGNPFVGNAGWSFAANKIFWSSTTVASDTSKVWCLDFDRGLTVISDKNTNGTFSVWPVRGGQ